MSDAIDNEDLESEDEEDEHEDEVDEIEDEQNEIQERYEVGWCPQGLSFSKTDLIIAMWF